MGVEGGTEDPLGPGWPPFLGPQPWLGGLLGGHLVEGKELSL